jgi:hypothetical protein
MARSSNFDADAGDWAEMSAAALRSQRTAVRSPGRAPSE